MSAHECHAAGCNRKVPPRLLFCGRHWAMVPEPWKRVVWREYRPGQEVSKDPSHQYILVQAAVVAIVAVRERVWTIDDAKRHMSARIGESWKFVTREWVETLPTFDPDLP